jgi:hypothetical protein
VPIRTHFAVRCRTRTATPIPALTMLGSSIPSSCTILIWNDLHLNVPVGNNRRNNVSGCVRTGPAKLLHSMRQSLAPRSPAARISEIGFGSVQFLSARSRNGRAKVKTIRALLKTAEISVREIATRFGVSRSILYRNKLA